MDATMRAHTKTARAPEASQPLAPALPATGFLRLPQIIGRRPTKTDPQGIPALVPVSRATWWQWTKNGRAPAPVRLGPNTTAWKVEDVMAFIERMGGAA